MRKLSIIIALTSGLFLSSCTVNESSSFSLIPTPQNMKTSYGSFSIQPETQILVFGDLDKYKNEIGLFNGWLQMDLSYNYTDNPDRRDNTILLAQNPEWQEQQERYKLEVGKFGIKIIVGGPAGAFYAFQTIRQLIETGNGKPEIPSVDIKDYP